MLLIQAVEVEEEIRQAKRDLDILNNNYNFAEGFHVSVLAYKLKAAEERYNSLIAERKRLTHGLVQV
jgi:plasmid maintenance system antidote protein VapI